ncbi:MAG: hypothetical protein Q9177_005308 [Variospora cf. flavescens]
MNECSQRARRPKDGSETYFSKLVTPVSQEDSTIADLIDQRQKFGDFGSVTLDAVSIRAGPCQNQSSKVLRSVKRRFLGLRAALGLENSSKGHRDSSQPAQDPMEASTHVVQEGQVETGPFQVVLDQPMDHRLARSQNKNEDVIQCDDGRLQPMKSDVIKAREQEDSWAQSLSIQADGSQGSPQGRPSMQYTQPPQGAPPDVQLPTSVPNARALEIESKQDTLTMQSSSSNTITSPEDFKTSFQIVIHLPQDSNAQRVSVLDTGAGLDVINPKVVESLKLEKERYQGEPIHPLGGIYEPEWQVTFDWHVAHRFTTYTTTFAVLDDKHSGDFDVLLGKESIHKIGFWKKNNSVWQLPTDDEGRPIR